MNGLTIPLNLDISGFDKSIEQARKRIDDVANYISSPKGSTKRENDTFFSDANKTANAYKGTAQEYREALRTLESLSDAINIKTKEGGDQLIANYNHWVNIRKAMGEASVNFQQLYNMQLEYTRLTGKKYEVKDISDVSKLQSEIQYHKDFLKLLDEEAAAIKKANKEKEASDALFYKKKQMMDDAAAKQNRLSRLGESKSGYKEYYKNLKEYEDYLKEEARLQEKRVKESKRLEEQKTKDEITERNKARKEITDAFNSHFNNIEKLNQSKRSLASTADNLMKKLAVVFSIRQIQQFAMQVITIGGELERQRVALGSIVKDISAANVLFSELKKQSLNSPFTFTELISSTKQLAAFNIETEKLKDTQFMLSELSAGLGVDVSRLILAFGQVRAASVLRGQELRQFTEAGIPILDALADKFSMIEGRAVSVGEVFEKVSNRMVSFQMVNDVLQDMTQEGGKFFEMQAKQADTVYGQWKIIGDRKQMMFQDIAVVMEEPIKGVAKLIRTIYDNWRGVGFMFSAYAASFAIYSAAQIFTNRDLIKTHLKEILLMDVKIFKRKEELGLTLSQNMAMKSALALAGGLYTVAAAAVTFLGAKIYEAATEMSRFRSEIEKINTRVFSEYSESASHLDRLINSLANYNQGSVAHRDILEKIKSKYGEYIPLLIDEKTTMDELVAVYGVATEAMKSYHAEKAQTEAMSKINEDDGIVKKQEDLVKRTKENLETIGVSNGDAARLTNLFIETIKNAIAQGNEIEDYTKLLQDLADKMGVVVDAQKVVEGNSAAVTPTGFVVNSGMSGIDTFIRKFENDSRKKLGTVLSANEAYFGAYAQSIKDGLLKVEKEYNKGISEINNSGADALEKELKVAELERRKKLAETAVRSSADMTKFFTQSISKLGLKERDVAQREAAIGLATYIDNIFKYGIEYAKSNFSGLWSDDVKSLARNAMKDLKNLSKDGFDEYAKSVGRAMDKTFDLPLVQSVIGKFVEREANAIDKLSPMGNEFKKHNRDILNNVREQTMTFKTLEDAYERLPSMYDETLSNIKMQEDILKKSTLLSKGERENRQKSLDDEKKKLKVQSKLMQELGIPFGKEEKKAPQSTSKSTDPRIEQAKRLVQIYNEMYSSYKKYSEVMDDDKASKSSIRDQSDSWNELNKEMGGTLGNIKAITSQKELIEYFEKAKTLFVSTPQAVKDITRNLINARSGQELEDAKKKIKEVDDELKTIDDKYSFGRNLDVLNEGLLFKTPDVFKEHTLSAEEYVGELNRIIGIYNQLGSEGVEKAMVLSMKIQELGLTKMKDTILETIRIKNELMNLDEKIAYQEGKLTEYQVLLEQEKDDIKRENLKALIAQTTKFLDDLKSDRFRASSLYEIIYGDLEQYGRKAQEVVIKQLKQLLEKAKNATPDSGGFVNIEYFDEKGIKQSTKVKVEEITRALIKLDKEERKINESKPFGKFKENLGKIKQTTTDVNDGTKEAIKNTDAVGGTITEVGDIANSIGDVFGILGFTDAEQVTKDVATGIAAIGKLIATDGADVGSWVSLVQSVMSLIGDDLFSNIEGSSQWYQRKYDENARPVMLLEREYNKLNRAIEETIRLSEKTDIYKSSLENLQAQKDVATQNVELAKEQYNQLLRGQDLIKKQGSFVVGGSKKRKKAQDEIDKMEDAYIQAANRLEDELKKIVEEFGLNLSSVADTFTDNWISAIEEVGTGVGSLEKSFNDLFKGIARKQIAETVLKPMLDPFVDYINSIVNPNSDGGIAITDKELDGAKKLYKEASDKIGDAGTWINDLFGKFGIVFSGGGKEFDSLQKGISGITENTAEIIASYLNSVRIEVVTIRTILESSTGRKNVISNDNSSSIMLQYYPQYLDNLIAINENTSYLKSAYEPSKRALRMA